VIGKTDFDFFEPALALRLAREAADAANQAKSFSRKSMRI